MMKPEISPSNINSIHFALKPESRPFISGDVMKER